MRRSALESLQRGARNLLANWELLLVQLVGALAVTLLTLVGTVPLLVAVGFETVRSLLSAGPRSGAPPSIEIEAAVEQLTSSLGPLIVALLVASVVWTVALIASAYFQAGTFGVLAGGERRAVAAHVEHRAFRFFSLREFTVSAERYLWRFFWLINVFLLFGLGVVLLLALGLGLTGWLVADGAAAAAVVTGCSTALVATLVAVSLGVWWQLSLAVSVVRESRIWASIGSGFSVLVRRLGAVVVLLLAFAAAGLAVFIVFLPASMVVEVAVRDALWVYAAVQIVLTVVQSLASGLLGLVYSGSIIALVQGERALEEAVGA